MKESEIKLKALKEHVEEKNITIMIMGLGSVGTYLLDYLLSRNDEGIRVVVVGRSADKMESNVNIIRIGALIRGLNKSSVVIEPGVDFNNTQQMAEVFGKYQPDIIVNSSRVYSGLKYGSISWSNLRAYGIWTPLSVKYIKNMMEAYGMAESKAIVMNTSYSDAVIPWLKTAGKNYPDFGSGNLNHLIPRIKYAAAELMGIKDFWNVDVVLATAHFHDVVISKEGHTEGMEQLLKVFYQGKEAELSQKDIFEKCKIAMPVDGKRNIMNASSNYEIIKDIIDGIREKEVRRFFSPGAFGEIGGYPVILDASKDCVDMRIDTSVFSMEAMRNANRQSIAFDGIENVADGRLVYTDQLLQKVKDRFGVTLPKEVAFEEIDPVAELLIEKIIKPAIEA